MKAIACILLGYVLGSLSPSALAGKIKKRNLREVGTKNLGATNTLLTLGKKWALFVLLFDMAKAFAAVKIAELLFPGKILLSLLAGLCAILGHIFPFYMRFKGGKGLAAFGGMILATDPWRFLFLLVLTTALMFIVNYSFIMPYGAATLYPIMTGVLYHSLPAALVCAAASAVIMIKHRDNLQKARAGADMKIRESAKKIFGKKK